MIDLDLVRSSPELFQAACKAKNIKLDVAAFLKLDEKRRSVMVEVQTMQAERNAVSKKMPTVKDKTEKETIVKEMKVLGGNLKEQEAALALLEND